MEVKIIPTNHLLSKEIIVGALDRENPDIIGIELCEFREKVILDKLGSQKVEEDKSLLGEITAKIKEKAEEEGLDYGSDMKAALNYSIENNIPRVLVDMPSMKIQELFGKIPWREREGFSRELAEFGNTPITDEVTGEGVVAGMKARYPIAFEFLINMRNLYMANQILIAQKNNPKKKIVVLLGEAHAKQVNKLIGGKQ